ncbi:MAG: hypothetical protein ACPG5B_02060 [Chitinophagales bacterium]
MNTLKLVLAFLLSSMMFAATTANANSVFAPVNLCANTNICQQNGNRIQINGTFYNNAIYFTINNLDSRDFIGTYIVLQDDVLLRSYGSTNIQISNNQTFAINPIGTGSHTYTLKVTSADGEEYIYDIPAHH